MKYMAWNLGFTIFFLKSLMNKRGGLKFQSLQWLQEFCLSRDEDCSSTFTLFFGEIIVVTIKVHAETIDANFNSTA